MFGRRKAEDPEAEYAERLAVFQIRHGLNSIDLTPAQYERLRAYEWAQGDVRMAAGLIYGRRLYRSGRWLDDR